MIDTHAHTDFKEYDNDRKDVLRRYFENGGEKLLNVGCDLLSSKRSLDLAVKNENIFCSVGVHPHDADSVNEKSITTLQKLAEHHKVVAIGEIGLDFYRNLSSKEKQFEALRMQIELADFWRKPLIIHCRDAYNELLLTLNEYKNSDWSGVIHCFSGSWEIAQKFLDLGFYLGFTGIITFYKHGLSVENIPEIHNVVKKLPIERLLVETDCPYLSPIPYRGERNEPLHVKYVIAKIAEIKNITVREIEKFTTKNATQLFHL